ncbi:MAG: tetratricopeptide repeat protein [Polyangiales bacterium]
MSEGNGNFSEPPNRGPMDQFSAHLDRGWDLVHRGDLTGARRSAEKSLELDSESAEAHNLLGYVSAAIGSPETALEHYKQAIALDDSFVEAMLNAAEVLIHPLHDFGAATGLIDEALEWAESDDEVADALLLKFDAHMHQGDQDAARQLLRTLPDGPFESARLDFLVGRACFEVGELDTAKPHLERAVQREPENPDARYYMGLLHDSRGDHDAATVELLRCRELDSGAPRPQWSWSQEHFERQLREAIERLDERRRSVLEGALVVVSDLPGAEVVADGVDPRAAVLLDALRDREAAPRAGRAFVYQRNVERACESPAKLDDELLRLLQAEIDATFPNASGAPSA